MRARRRSRRRSTRTSSSSRSTTRSIRELARTFGRWPWPRVAMSFVHRLPAPRAGEGRRRRRAVHRARQGRRPTSSTIAGRRVERRQSDSALADAVQDGGQRRHARRRRLRRARRAGKGRERGEVERLRRITPGRSRVPRPLVLAPFQELTDAARGARPQLPDARRRRPGAPDGAVHHQRRQGAAVARRRRGAARRRLRAGGRCGRRASPAHRRPARAAGASERIGGRRPADDADQLSRAGAGARTPRASSCGRTRRTSSAHLFCAEQEHPRQARSRWSIRRSSRTRSCSSVSPRRACWTCSARRSSTDENGSMPGIQLHASMTDSILRTGSSSRRRRARASASILIAALAIGMLAAFLPFTTAAGRLAGDPRRMDVVHGDRLQERAVAEPGAAARGRWPGALLRDRLPVLRRGQREAESREAVRPIRVPRRLLAADGQPGPGGARGQAPGNDSFVLGHPRFHDRNRARRPRGARQPAERVLLADGRNRVQQQGNRR